MAEKIARTGIKRENDMMYYIKNGDVWAVPRKRPGQPKGRASKVAAAGIEMDYSKYLYFLDSDGDIARQARQVGGSKRKKTKKTPSRRRPQEGRCGAPRRRPGRPKKVAKKSRPRRSPRSRPRSRQEAGQEGRQEEAGQKKR